MACARNHDAEHPNHAENQKVRASALATGDMVQEEGLSHSGLIGLQFLKGSRKIGHVFLIWGSSRNPPKKAHSIVRKAVKGLYDRPRYGCALGILSNAYTAL